MQSRPASTASKISRNEPCPCGSGKKYKKCCLGLERAKQAAPAVTVAEVLRQGMTHQQAWRLAEAEAAYRQVLTDYPQQPDALHLLGLLAHQIGKLETAAEFISQSITASPDNAVYYHNLGVAYLEQGKLELALACYRKALALKPDYAHAHGNIGVVLKEQGRLDEAITFFQKAINLAPDYYEAYSNLGVCYKDLNQWMKAATCLEQALRLNPVHAPTWNNLGRLYEATGEALKAVACYRKAFTVKPDDVELQHNLALLLLSVGEFAEGWALYESRYHPARKSRNTEPPKLPFAQWRGESLASKSLLIWPEQGFGDQIQFCRYIPMLKAMGAAFITLICKKPMQPLLATLAGVDQIVVSNEGNTIGRHDFWTFPLSIPLHCRTTLETIPIMPRYLSALPERVQRWQDQLPLARPRVGLVWKGSSAHKNDANRSIAHLRLLAPVWSVPGIAFVSLQKGQGEDEVEGLPLTHLGSAIEDFADTAAIVSQLDLLICVDTSVAHLAGALGKPVWVLLPLAADWRWLIGREDSPWYPGMTLFRQSQAGVWDDVFARVRERLEALSAG